MGEWPAYCLRPFKEETWFRIFNNIAKNNSSIDDLEGTDLFFLAEEFNQEPEKYEHPFFYYLKEIDRFSSIPVKFPFYCLFDSGLIEGSGPLFFESKEELRDAFEEKYAVLTISWENLDDVELEYRFDRLEKDFAEFPLNSYD